MGGASPGSTSKEDRPDPKAAGELRFCPGSLWKAWPILQPLSGPWGVCGSVTARVHTELKIQPRSIYSFIVFRSVTLWGRMTDIYFN